MIVLVKLFAGQVFSFPAFHHSIYINHILPYRWFCFRQYRFRQASLLFHDKFIQKEPHQFCMAGITDGFIIQRIHFSLQGFTKRSQSATGTKGFKLLPFDVDQFNSIQRGNHFPDTIVNNLGIIDIFIDNTGR